jgi:hypothetical protein
MVDFGQNLQMSGTEGFSDATWAYIHNFIGNPLPSPEVVRRDFFDQELLPVQTPVPIPGPERPWSEDEWATIKRGHRSHGMDDKWDGIVEDDRLYLHRSWTGRGIYEATFMQVGSEWKIRDALVTNDSNYQPSPSECESLFLEVIIETVLLGEWPAPKLEAVVRCLRGSGQS